MRSRLILSLVPVFVLLAACGDDAPNEFTTANTSADGSGGTATDTGAPADLPETSGNDSATGDGDGDGDPGDGDGDGDGDTNPGDGDGDTGVGACGDGAVDIGEQCDGADLNGFTCVDLGYAGGELACDPVTCTYDASACETDMDGGNTSGGTSG
jgi:hypothetical protein